jgi:metal-responsive CopG/Arc/MetJ family transcriptional regulator
MSMTKYRRISVTLPEDLAELLDKKRGLIPRSTYVAHWLAEHLKGEPKKKSS